MKLPAWLASWKSTLSAVLVFFFGVGPSFWPGLFLHYGPQIQAFAGLAASLGLLVHKDTSVALAEFVEQANLHAAPDHPYSLESVIKSEVGGVATTAIDKALGFEK